MAYRTKNEVVAAIDAALAEKIIRNVDHTELKESLTHLIDVARDVAQKAYLAVHHANPNDAYNEVVADLYYAHAYPATFGAMVKKVAKATKLGVPAKYNNVLKVYQDYVTEYASICEKFVSLKPFIVKGRKPVEAKIITVAERKALLAEKETQQDTIRSRVSKYQDKYKARARVREINALLSASDAMTFGTSPVAVAVLPLKEAAMEYARKCATERVAALKNELATAGWNMDVVAPRSTREDGVFVARMKDMVRAEYFVICETDSDRLKAEGFTGYSRVQPTYVKYSAKNAKRWIDNEVRAAGLAFDAFITKMDHKIGDHDTAKVEGEPWVGCDVTITKNGVVERWHTQQIINYSVRGKAYNQWPTRLMK